MGNPQKSMVYKGKSQSKMDDLEVPIFQEAAISLGFRMFVFIKCHYSFLAIGCGAVHAIY